MPKKPATLAIRVFFGAALFILTTLPLTLVLWRSFRTADAFSLDFYREAYGKSVNLRALGNTLFISISAVAFSALIAIPSAWLVTRTDVPARRRLRALLLLPYVVPPYLGAIAWINLCNPSVGWLNRALGAGVFNIYSLGGIIWVESLFLYTFIYLNCVAAMENTDASFEEAARVSGAAPLQVLFTITLPLIRPAILSGAFLVFAAAAASFGVPALVGDPGHVQVLTTQIYSSVKTGGINGGSVGAALSVVLLALAFAMSAFADRLAHGRRVTALSGKAARIARVRLGRWQWPAFGFLALVVTLTCLLPLAAIAATSLMKVVGVFNWDNFTLAQYRYVLFERRATARGFVNSMLLSLGAATLAVVVGAALAYIKGHPRRRLGRSADLCINLPYAAPGTILAFGLILVWSRPVRLTDTLWILLLAYFAKYLSFAVRALTTNVQQVDVSFEEAARVSGAGFFTTFRTIWLPLLRPAMLASWFLVFMPAFSELTMSVLLVGPGTETIGTTLFQLQSYGDPPSASVLAVVVLALILGAYALAVAFAPKQRSAQ